jgi:hypothetical protein
MKKWFWAPLWALVAAAALTAADSPRIVYSKSFPGSNPAYVSITVEKNGAAAYKEAPDDELPIRLQMAAADASELFNLAGKLTFFKRPLESPLKVANMGMKTFRFENGPEVSETKFNFTEDVDARALHDWFERIAETCQSLAFLQRTVKYDKLGVMKALLALETSRERKRLVAEKEFLPMLDRIVKNESFLHMARTRAAGLAESIRAGQQ